MRIPTAQKAALVAAILVSFQLRSQSDALATVNAYLESGRVKEAIALLNRHLVRDQENHDVYLLLGFTYLELARQPGDAELTFRQALVHFPDDPVFLNLLGHSLLAQAQSATRGGVSERALERAAEAAEVFDRASNRAPTQEFSAATFLALGASLHAMSDIHRREGRRGDSARAQASASKAYEQALRFDPGLAKEIRDRQIDLLLPTPRFPETYSMHHLAVGISERIDRIRAQIAFKSPVPPDRTREDPR